MDPKEAQQIARHHLGDMLQRVDDVEWINGVATTYEVVAGRPGALDRIRLSGSDVDALARDAATRLRAAGWVPTHPRLEWQSRKWQHHLCFLMDNFRVELFFVYNGANGWTVWRRHDADNEVVACRVTAPVAAAHVAEWCAANLPSLHLPPFPETPDAA